LDSAKHADELHEKRDTAVLRRFRVTPVKTATLALAFSITQFAFVVVGVGPSGCRHVSLLLIDQEDGVSSILLVIWVQVLSPSIYAVGVVVPPGESCRLGLLHIEDENCEAPERIIAARRDHVIVRQVLPGFA